MYQGVLLCPPLLRTHDRNDLAFPVQLFKAQTGNLAAAKAIDCKQHQDGLITYVTRLIAASTADESLYVRPMRPNRERFLLKHTRPLDAGRYTTHTPTPHFSVPKERTQSFGTRSNSNSPPALAAFPSQKRINVSDRDFAERAALPGETAQKLPNMPAAIADCSLCQTTFAAHVIGKVFYQIRKKRGAVLGFSQQT
jgi:hypothetical protein